jgi:hypothetical protein
MKFTLSLVLLSMTLVLNAAADAKAPTARPYGLWTFASDERMFRIVSEAGVYTLVEDQLHRATLTNAGSQIRGAANGHLLSTFVSNGEGKVHFSKVSPTQRLSVTRLESFDLPIGFSSYQFAEALYDETGFVYLRGTDANGRSILAYARVGADDPDLVWDIVDYVPLKKMVAAPGGNGVVGLSEDGIAIYFRGFGSARRPRMALVEMNSVLNLVQDIAAGPVEGSLSPALAIVTAADAELSKPAQLYVVAESLEEALVAGRPIRLRKSTVVSTPFEVRGVLSNFQELSVSTLSKAAAAAKAPQRILPRAIRELARELARSKDPCRTLLRFKSEN